MRHVNNKKQETTHDERNGTTKSRKNQIAREKVNIQMLENIGSSQHQTSENERKITKEYLRRTRKLIETKLLLEPHKRNKYP